MGLRLVRFASKDKSYIFTISLLGVGTQTTYLTLTLPSLNSLNVGQSQEEEEDAEHREDQYKSHHNQN